jgi:hypothetical protein
MASCKTSILTGVVQLIPLDSMPLERAIWILPAFWVGASYDVRSGKDRQITLLT